MAYTDKDYLISAHWGSTVRSSMEGDKSLGLTERSKEDCLHKYKAFQIHQGDYTPGQPMGTPQTAHLSHTQTQPLLPNRKHTVDKSKNRKAKDIPLDIPVIIHSRNGL
ncbi:hypothetical protein LSTR_LSTR016185 [Laodelphax striatellus]|uniref:Uncharacterized protein n=1 Tax=Laodelphax striatellus TaxID=195883 RepID=A0A482WUC9_LAOST|nr:hypothetical protein LSTR_LSTR016185 [Laodelphax striatellus]